MSAGGFRRGPSPQRGHPEKTRLGTHGVRPSSQCETRHDVSLVFLAPGGVAKTRSTPGTAAFRILPRSGKFFAIRRAGFHHGQLVREQRIYRAEHVNVLMLDEEALVVRVDHDPDAPGQGVHEVLERDCLEIRSV